MSATAGGAVSDAALTAKLKAFEELSPTHVETVDQSGGCGAKFAVLVVADVFDGKSRLERHRLVNRALVDDMPHIHALSIKALTPQQWQDRQKADGDAAS
mmetsp:Transcript_6633/g.16044  ORF Transcript_6633/g.16044 Transcript_6633/m.16044 type:complete len:100 (-) Transcript_6633:64-363(-)|eukprot:CAMPEP_0198339176 /NCGR_PEP_ID=MMETSP1450-20131203/38214_1 /TAXON_ID=753684 ORGANISM="Madagascaria erythrocladiodes, Strain CCMP3234" /NCGR_SAMPLE_ID=MMETSP1450 /ASSEMBLY_ACC=CAM_ASM_001115 /LENGTH=99 /DNA_ID=CAMNT_0044044085 /DNA_START=60 /DNA_END=359 /DNA_ORIENTATION=+